MDIGKVLAMNFCSGKTVKIVRVNEDGVVLEWIVHAGATKVTTEVGLSNDAVIATAQLLSEYVSRMEMNDERS